MTPVVTLCGALSAALFLSASLSCRREALADVPTVGDGSTQTRLPNAARHAEAPALASAGASPAITDLGRTVVLDRDPAWRRLASGLTARRARVRLEDGTVDEWRVLRLDMREISLTVRAASGTERVSEAALDPRALAAIDGGFFDAQHRPSGTLVSEGVELAPYNPGAGSGLLVVRDRVASMLEGSSVVPRPATELAVQCGPRLIEGDGSVGIYRDDGQRWARTAACVRDGGRTLDLVTAWLPASHIRGPGLLAFARALARTAPFDEARGCELALNLDGGPSTGLWVRGAADFSREATGPTPWLLVARARAR